MPRIYKVSGESSDSPIRPFLAIPSYGGMNATFVASLWETQIALKAAGYPVTLEILSEHCHVDDSRNLLVRDFLETDCTDLIFLDSDIGWNGDSIIKILKSSHDIVAGVYPLKQDVENFPVLTIPGILQADEEGCVEVKAAPTGFLRIRRNVFEKLEESANKFKARQDSPSRRPISIIFERTFQHHEDIEGCQRVGGDYSFCFKARDAGFKVYVSPEISFEHVGDHAWEGSLGDFWRRTNGVYELNYKAGFIQLSQGIINDNTISRILDYWGNKPWSAGEHLVTHWALLAKEHGDKILEIGAGITSLIAAAVNKDNEVYALEHDFEWSLRIRKAAKELGLGNLHVIDTELVDDWYKIPEGMPDKFNLVLVDGPPRWKSDRSIFMNSPFDVSDAVVLFDDMDCEFMTNFVNAFAAKNNSSVKIINHPSKNFAICSPNTEKVSTAA